MYAKMNEVYLSRPARKQKDFIDPKKYHMEGAQEYNIWYGKFIGDIADKMDKVRSFALDCIESLWV